MKGVNDAQVQDSPVFVVEVDKVGSLYVPDGKRLRLFVVCPEVWRVRR